jgi:hypothetical protein
MPPKVRKESEKQTGWFGKVAKEFSGGRKRMPEGIKKPERVRL